MSQKQSTKKPTTNAARLVRWFSLALLLIIIGTIITVLLQPVRSGSLALAQTAFLGGDYTGAIELFSAAIAEKPNDSEAYIGRGLAYTRTGQSDLARSDFLRAVELDANDIRPLHQLGLIAVSMEQYPSAIDYFTRVIALDGKSARAYASRGLAHTQNLNYLLAIEDYNQAIALDATVADFYLGLGDAHYALDNTAEALAAYERYIELAETVNGMASLRVDELRNR
jgi:tetratricopeptide (TPR) repeat protein